MRAVSIAGLAARHALARPQRDRRLGADRELPRQPEGLRRALRRHRARARARAAAAARHPPTEHLSATAVYARRFVSLVKLEHTMFALPVRLRRRDPCRWARCRRPATLVWITLAMVGARSLAMALNRLIDAEIDARNPRTAAPRDPRRPAVAHAGARLLRPRRWPCSSWPSGSSTPITRWLWPIPVAGVRDLPVPQALHVALPPVRWASSTGSPRSAAWVAVTDDVDRHAVPARRRGRALDRRLRRHLRHDGRRVRPPRGPALDPAPVRDRPGPVVTRVCHLASVVLLLSLGRLARPRALLLPGRGRGRGAARLRELDRPAPTTCRASTSPSSR